jgi:hypothetical protein
MGSLDLDQLAAAAGEAIGRGLVTARRLRERADLAGDRPALRIERALATIETRSPPVPTPAHQSARSGR